VRSAFRLSLDGAAEARRGGLICDNEPYSASDASDYTIPAHGERHGLLHVEIEIRQDLIADDSGQRAWGALLARLLPQAYRELGSAGARGSVYPIARRPLS
jgi:predicted N-formylglutamate amidohydrolase